MTLHEVTIVIAQKGEARQVGDTLGAGFQDDPIMAWELRNPKAFGRQFAIYARDLVLPYGFAHRAEDFSGAAMWLPPKVPTKERLKTKLSLGWLALRFGGVGALRRGMEIAATMETRKPEGEFFYLGAIAVRPEFQGRGIGGKLLRAGLERVDAAHMPAYLESSKAENIPIYQNYGYDVIDEFDVGIGGPRCWAMWREAIS